MLLLNINFNKRFFSTSVLNGNVSIFKPMIETSTTRTKNTVNILIKNMLDAFIGAVSYWAIGWGLAYGANGNPFLS